MLGFVVGVDGLSRLSEILSDTAAVMRGGDMLVRPQDGLMRLRPWTDGSGDEITMTPLSRDCGAPGTPTEIVGPLGNLIGYQCVYPDGAIRQTLSFRGDRLLSVLADFDGPGVKTLCKFPKSVVKDSGGGFWRPDWGYQFGGFGSGDIDLFVQPDESGNPDVIQPRWGPGSVAGYHRSKANNRNASGADAARNYMTGKAFHAPPPFCALWGPLGGLIGVVRGVWEIVNGEWREAYPMAELQPFLASAATVSVDATLGYTSAGAYGLSAKQSNYFGPYAATENGTVTSMSFCTCSSVNNNMIGYMYVGSGTSPDGTNLLTNSQTSSIAVPTTPVKTWYSPGYLTSPSIANGTSYWFTFSADANALFAYFDNVTTSQYYRYKSTNYSTAPNPCPTTTASSSNKAYSTYITYTPAASGQPAMRRWGGVPHMRVGRGGW